MSASEPDINENIKSLLSQVHQNQDTPSTQAVDDLDKLELAKIIVTEILSDDNLKSLSLLNSEQVEDITNALLLNEYYQITDIDHYINNYLKLKRSTSGYLIDHLTSMAVSQGNNQESEQQKNIFNRVFRR